MAGGSAIRNRSEIVTVLSPRGPVEVVRQEMRGPPARQLMEGALARASEGKRQLVRGLDRPRGDPQGDAAPAAQPTGLAARGRLRRRAAGHSDRPGQCLAAASLGRPILVSAIAQSLRLVIENRRCTGTYRKRPLSSKVSQLITLEPMVTADDVTDALRDVIDPELGLDFVELGLIYGVDLDGGAVHVTFTLTSPGCPIGPQVSEQIQEFVGELDGVEDVQSTMTFSPPWTSERMSEDAKFALGF
jgi:metal-sulfur cluster biosynthetic enzyme